MMPIFEKETMKTNVLYNEHNMLTLARLTDCSVHMIVTSPPYDGIRPQYRPLEGFPKLAKELLRVLVPGGILCWVVNNQVKDYGESMTAERQAVFFSRIGFQVQNLTWEKTGFATPATNYYHRVTEHIYVCCKGRNGPRVWNPLEDRRNIYRKKENASMSIHTRTVDRKSVV